jgi:hypothetical protein
MVLVLLEYYLFSIGSGGPITAGRAFINEWQNDRQPSRHWLVE